MQEIKRPIILAKKADKDDKSVAEKPRILLKSKDSSEQSKSPAIPTQISIASRPIEPSTSNADSSKTYRSQPAISVPATKEVKDSHLPSTSNDSTTVENALPKMKKPFTIISEHLQIQNHAQDFLIESNTDFHVVGIIGTQGSGKSFILNMLNDDIVDMDDAEHVNKLLKGRAGVFPMRSLSNEKLSNMPVTDGIQMYITRHRTILLDCMPLLCNPYKKEAVFNELDDLKTLIFLLGVCNTLIVVEDCGFNMHLMRLLLTAESMKVDVYENHPNERRHSPNILLFKNKCRNREFLVEAKKRTKHLYRAFFECSGLKMTQSCQTNDKKSIEARNEEAFDVLYFPWIDSNSKI